MCAGYESEEDMDRPSEYMFVEEGKEECFVKYEDYEYLESRYNNLVSKYEEIEDLVIKLYLKV